MAIRMVPCRSVSAAPGSAAATWQLPLPPAHATPQMLRKGEHSRAALAVLCAHGTSQPKQPQLMLRYGASAAARQLVWAGTNTSKTRYSTPAHVNNATYIRALYELEHVGTVWKIQGTSRSCPNSTSINKSHGPILKLGLDRSHQCRQGSSFKGTGDDM